MASSALPNISANTIKPIAIALTVDQASHIGRPGSRLLTHSNDDLLFSEGQHCAAARALQMHDHAGVVFQPQIAAARRGETGLAGALCISARKIGDARELIDGARSADFLNPATGTRNRAYKLEWVGTPLVFQDTAAAAQAGDEVLSDRHVSRGRQARDAL